MKHLSIACLFLLTASCSRAETSSTPAPDPTGAKTGNGTTASAGAPLVLARGVRFVKAGPDDDVARLVRGEREKARADGRDLLVYVGAKWCEPCQRFHAAAQRGELDTAFPELTLLEFDVDVDRERILNAGYGSKLIPLFVRPGEDGRGSDQRFEGGVKGDGAVGNITPRLHRLLTK